MRERAELREGLLGKVGKFQNLNKQVEMIVTRAQKQVEKIVTRAHSGWCFVEASISCGKTSISHA